jgi:hypothetical protein
VSSYALKFVLALILGCGLLSIGCSQIKTDDATRAAETKLLGVWNGISVNDCSPIQFDPSRCRAVERISFTMLRQSGRSWGFYRCAPGTTPCYNLVDRGDIKYLELAGRTLWLRVMRDDHSSCLFDAIPDVDRMRGRFWCFQGTELIERGVWHVERVY